MYSLWGSVDYVYAVLVTAIPPWLSWFGSDEVHSDPHHFNFTFSLQLTSTLLTSPTVDSKDLRDKA